MRIAIVIERYAERGGGAEQAAWNVAHALDRLGHDVHVVARTSVSCPPDGITLHEVRVPDAWQPLRVAAFSKRAESLLRGDPRGFDVVHSFCRTRHQDIYRTGGGSHADYMERTYGKVAARLRRLTPRHHVQLDAEARIFRDEQQLIHCVSSLVRNEIMRRWDLPAERFFVLHNGVDHARFDAGRHTAEAARLRRHHGAEDDTVWLFAGSGGRRKGLDIAIRAIALAGSADARLWVAGRDDPGRWRRLAKRLGIEARVLFLGDQEEIAPLYAAADGLLLPTRYDPFANCSLEAASSGIPVVTSRANGAAEVVAKAGIVVESAEDVRAFAEAVRQLDNASRRRELGAIGRKIALQHGWDDHARKLESLYGRSIESGTHRSRPLGEESV